MDQYQQYFETNKGLWDQLAALHKDSEWYEVAAFKSGQSSLRELELQELGEVRGKSLLHLQCHFGMDTLSWGREGASVTGVDISEEAINAARELASEIGVPGDFICSDLYSAPQKLDRQFDIVFTSYGVLGWLPDLQAWARVVRHFLKPGGTFYIAEFHPFIWLFDDDFAQIKYSYFNLGPDFEISEGSYADREAPIKHGSYYWSHPLGEVANALTQQGLVLDFIHEFDYVNYNCLKGLEEIGKYRYILPKWGHKIPYMYSIKATLPAD
jgi:SAM-dependent methyltransferase